jgi:hypothetical protein
VDHGAEYSGQWGMWFKHFMESADLLRKWLH